MNAVPAEPLADEFDVPRSGVVVHDVGVRQVHLVRRPDGVPLAKQPNADTVSDAQLDEVVTLARQWLERAVGDLTDEPGPARRVAVGANVPLHEDAVEHRVLGIVNPVLFCQVLAPDADVHAPYRGEPQPRRGPPQFLWRLAARRADEYRQRHRADELPVGDLLARL